MAVKGVRRLAVVVGRRMEPREQKIVCVVFFFLSVCACTTYKKTHFWSRLAPVHESVHKPHTLRGQTGRGPASTTFPIIGRAANAE